MTGIAAMVSLMYISKSREASVRENNFMAYIHQWERYMWHGLQYIANMIAWKFVHRCKNVFKVALTKKNEGIKNITK